MAKIIFDGKTYSVTATGHISYTNKEYSHEGGGGCNSWDEHGNCTGYAPTYPVYNYPTRKADATIKGKITGTVSNVYVQGKNPVTLKASVKETDEFTLPSTATTSGDGHTGASATLNGNTRNVYVNGSLMVLSGSKVDTHVSSLSVTLDTNDASSSVNVG